MRVLLAEAGVPLVPVGLPVRSLVHRATVAATLLLDAIGRERSPVSA